MKKNISTWQLALMTAAAVISLRGLPMMAQEELTMFFPDFVNVSPKNHLQIMGRYVDVVS